MWYGRYVVSLVLTCLSRPRTVVEFGAVAGVVVAEAVVEFGVVAVVAVVEFGVVVAAASVVVAEAAAVAAAVRN
jgi:hypothetical protein